MLEASRSYISMFQRGFLSKVSFGRALHGNASSGEDERDFMDDDMSIPESYNDQLVIITLDDECA